MAGPPSVAIPTLDQTSTTKSHVDSVPVQQGGTVEFRPSHDQGIVGAAGGGAVPGDGFGGNLQPQADANDFAITHDADQEVQLFVGEWCKVFGTTPRAAMVHIRSIIDRLYVQVLS